MSDKEIMKQGEKLVSLASQKGLDEMIKPLTREIHLFDSFVAGTTYIEDKSLVASLKAGDTLSLVREKNKYDANAVAMLNGKGAKVGYVPEKDDIVFARLLDAGKKLEAKVSGKKSKGGIDVIAIGIYLVDF